MKKKLVMALAVASLVLLSVQNFAQAPPLGTATDYALFTAQVPDLGTAADYVLFTTVGAVGNTGISQITGNVGTNIGSITGFGNVNGVMNENNLASGQCAEDLLTAYNQLNSTIPTIFPAPLLGNGQVFNAGVYQTPAATTLSGVLILDAQNDPNAVFIIQIEGPFSTAANSKVTLINGALACNVFWKVEGLVDMASGTTMRGTVITNNAAISMSVGGTLEGRALSTAGAVNVSGVLAYTPVGCGSPVLMGPAAPDLVSAACYAIFSSDGPVTNDGISYVTGDVGTNGTLTTGFNPLFVTGMIHPIPDGSTAVAAADLLNAYNYLKDIPYDIELLYPAQFGHNLVLTPHTYLLNAATSFTDTLYLNGGGQADAVFVIKIFGALSTSNYSKVILTNGTLPENVFWVVEGAVDITDYSIFKGTVIANNGAVNLGTGVNMDGRAFTTTGAIGITAATVTMPLGCGSVSSPEIITAPENQAACEGDMVSFSVSATGTGIEYQWRKGTENLIDGINIFGSTTETLTIDPVAFSDAALNYNVVVTGTYPPAVTSDNVSLTVQALPINVFAGNDATVCAICPFTLSTATAENYSSLLWTKTGDGTFDNEAGLHPTYTPGIADQGTFVTLYLHVGPIAPCDGLPYLDSLDLYVQSIQAGPVVYAGENQDICENQDANLVGNAQNYSGVMWSGGDGTFSAPESLVTNYTPGSGDIYAGTVELCLTAKPIDPAPDSVVDCLTLTIQALPAVIAGDNDTICESQVFETNPTIANYSQLLWETSGDGFFENETAVITNYFPGETDLANGQVSLCLSVTGNAPCESEPMSCLVLYFENKPIAIAGDNVSICQGNDLQLNGFADNYIELLWTTTGTGSFSNATILNPVYTPDIADINTGTVGICLRASTAGACISEVAEDCLVLSIVGETTIAGLNPELTLGCSDFDQVNQVFLPLELFPVIENASSILWTTDGDGTFNDPTVESAVYNLGTNDIWNGGFTLCVEAIQVACSFSAEACTHVIVPVQIIPITTPTWNGISSYVDKSATPVPLVMAPVVNELIIMINKAGKYYWPSVPVNRLGNWQAIGYKAKFNGPCCLPVYGQIVADQSFLINGSSTFLPVLTNVQTNIETLLGANASKVLMIYDWSNGMLWTNSAADLHTLEPGKAYLLINKSPSTSFSVTFPSFGTDMAMGAGTDVISEFEVINSPWNAVTNTSQPHIMLFADRALNEMQTGDIIGAFNDDGLSVGVAEIKTKDNFNKLIVVGNDLTTDVHNGYDSGEVMNFKLYRPETSVVYDIAFTYDPDFPNYDGRFEVNGVSSVINATMAITSINNLNDNSTIKVFPNPANDFINVSSDQNFRKIKMFNNTGQVVIDLVATGNDFRMDVSKYVKGLYFIQIETSDGYITTKRIIIE